MIFLTLVGFPEISPKMVKHEELYEDKYFFY